MRERPSDLHSITQGIVLMKVLPASLVVRLTTALALIGALCSLFAGDMRLDNSGLRIGDTRFLVHGVGYMPMDGPCGWARDLPLMAAMGANTVRTYQLLSGDDTTFTALLGTTGLHWLAGFPLEPYYDPNSSISARRDEILAAFRSYAQRFGGEPRLIAFVFGSGVVDNYNLKFAGPVTDFYSLLEDAAAVLQELQPDAPAMLTTTAGTASVLQESPAGLSFWMYNAGPVADLSAAISQIRHGSALPVLVAEYGADALDDQTTVRLTLQIAADTSLLGGVYATFADDPSSGQRLGIFQRVAPNLQPRQAYQTLAGLWGAASRRTGNWRTGPASRRWLTRPRARVSWHPARWSN